MFLNLLLASFILNVSAFQPGFIGRDFPNTNNMFNNALNQADRNDKILFIPGGPSGLLENLFDSGIPKENVVLADIAYDKNEQELRKLSEGFGDETVDKSGINFGFYEKLLGRTFSAAEREKLLDFIKLHGADQGPPPSFYLNAKQFYKEYKAYPQNYVATDITKLDPSLHQGFSLVLSSNLLHVYRSVLSEEFHLLAYKNLMKTVKPGGKILVYPIEPEDMDFIENEVIPMIEEDPSFSISFEPASVMSESNQILALFDSKRENTQILKIQRHK